jgi:hypothetical protein
LRIAAAADATGQRPGTPPGGSTSTGESLRATHRERGHCATSCCAIYRAGEMAIDIRLPERRPEAIRDAVRRW